MQINSSFARVRVTKSFTPTCTCLPILPAEKIIEKGYLYSAEPPLFRITTNKNKYIYLKDAAALEEYKNAHNGEKYLISRNQGLGEQDADELAECLLTPETRNIKQLIVQDYKKAALRGIMDDKRLTIFAGHYGSGKTNIAVNYAVLLAKEGKKVCIADLDIVNPYFRTKDSESELAEHGISLISSRYANTNKSSWISSRCLPAR